MRFKKKKTCFPGIFCLYRINFSSSLYLIFMVTILTTFKMILWYFTCWLMTSAIDNISFSYSSHLGMQWNDIFIPRIIFYIYETAFKPIMKTLLKFITRCVNQILYWTMWDWGNIGHPDISVTMCIKVHEYIRNVNSKCKHFKFFKLHNIYPKLHFKKIFRNIKMKNSSRF